MHKNSKELATALGNKYAMFYNPSILPTCLTPEKTIENSISRINQQLKLLGKNLNVWPRAHQNEITKLLRVNWLYQRLPIEPIRKPILVHKNHEKLCVDCGDTRLMALKLCKQITPVSVIITCLIDEVNSYANWQRIYTSQELTDCIGFDPDLTQIFFTTTPPQSTYAFTWFEIGDPSTKHHLHDCDQRVGMMQHYLDTQPCNFEFTVEWAKSRIDWQ
jgi:hypothetical protein